MNILKKHLNQFFSLRYFAEELLHEESNTLVRAIVDAGDKSSNYSAGEVITSDVQVVMLTQDVVNLPIEDDDYLVYDSTRYKVITKKRNVDGTCDVYLEKY